MVFGLVEVFDKALDANKYGVAVAAGFVAVVGGRVGKKVDEVGQGAQGEEAELAVVGRVQLKTRGELTKPTDGDGSSVNNGGLLAPHASMYYLESHLQVAHVPSI